MVLPLLGAPSEPLMACLGVSSAIVIYQTSLVLVTLEDTLKNLHNGFEAHAVAMWYCPLISNKKYFHFPCKQCCRLRS